MKSIFIAVAALLAPAVTLAQPLSARNGNGAYANILALKHPVSGEHSETPVNIPFGQLTHYDQEITGFQLLGVTISVPDEPELDASKVTCQRYNDAYGVQPGSAPFATGVNASVSTNLVDFGWVLCYVNADF